MKLAVGEKRRRRKMRKARCVRRCARRNPAWPYSRCRRKCRTRKVRP